MRVERVRAIDGVGKVDPQEKHVGIGQVEIVRLHGPVELSVPCAIGVGRGGFQRVDR